MAMSSTEHDELREQAELYVLGALTPADRDAFEAHMASCADCTANVKSLSPVTQALAYVSPQHEPPSDAPGTGRSLRHRIATPGRANSSTDRGHG